MSDLELHVLGRSWNRFLKLGSFGVARRSYFFDVLESECNSELFLFLKILFYAKLGLHGFLVRVAKVEHLG